MDGPGEGDQGDLGLMQRAITVADSVRGETAPNPWVGCVVVSGHDPVQVFEGATAPPGGPHAEVTALARAGDLHSQASTLFTTLEPCVHHGRTPPCTDAIIAAGVARVVIAVEDPDPNVAGRGVAALRAAGIDVTVGCGAAEVSEQLAPYLKHRTTGQPWVVLKMAASLDARTAAPDGTSRWITGPEARRDAHRLRARSDAIWWGPARYGWTIPS
jgi:diaminohydroxyphosphoribosylaminopyrimidine deaminase/5-amino-6-(5-phosphoribosylamino)uracil reductase